MNLPLALALAFAAAAAACSAAEAAPGASAIRTLARGAFSGIQEPELKVIRAAGEWSELWAKHSARAGKPEPAPKVDFEKEMVIAALLGRQKSGGHKIEVESAREENGKLRIVVKKTSPPMGAMTLQALSAPFHFAAIPRSELKPEFVEIEAAAAPRERKPAP